MVIIITLNLIITTQNSKDGKVRINNVGGFILSNIVVAISIFLISVLILDTILDIDSNIETYETTVIEENETEIASLDLKGESEGQVSGSFLGISGNLESEQYYYFYIKEDDSYTLQKIKTDNVKIKESEETPKIVYTKEKLIEKWKRTSGKIADRLNINMNVDWCDNVLSTKEKITLYIPKGSIKEFNPSIK